MTPTRAAAEELARTHVAPSFSAAADAIEAALLAAKAEGRKEADADVALLRAGISETVTRLEGWRDAIRWDAEGWARIHRDAIDAFAISSVRGITLSNLRMLRDLKRDVGAACARALAAEVKP